MPNFAPTNITPHSTTMPRKTDGMPFEIHPSPKKAKEFEKSILSWLHGFRRVNNPNVQQLMADDDYLTL